MKRRSQGNCTICGQFLLADGTCRRCTEETEMLVAEPPEGVFGMSEPNCPHGLPWEDCDHCMRASDFAYDAWRENR